MLDTLLSYVAPHHCLGCGFSGALLCDNCKYDIVYEPFAACGACGNGLAGRNGLCGRCHVPYGQIWCIADRRDTLESLINSYKFQNARAAYRPLAELLHERLPDLPAGTILIPVPTVSGHIRQRGYDHMLLIARRLSRLRGYPLQKSLLRSNTARQRGAGKRQRVEQAKRAFACRATLDPSRTYLLIDDVITTGATVHYAAQALIEAGAQDVRVASISRQPLD